MKVALCFSAITIIVSLVPSADSVQCMDEKGNAVDWFIVYKVPQIKSAAENKLINKGMAYLYLTADSQDNWSLSQVNIMDANDSIIAKTLQPIYQQQANNSILYIFYNDERPSKHDSKSKGHTKGLVAADSTSGLWLIHSVPLFPPNIEDGYSYPLSGTVYGQSFLCISLDHDNVDSVGVQLLYNQIQIYSASISNDLSLIYPNLTRVNNREVIGSPPWYNILNIHSKKGKEFVTFAKTRDFNKDLYADLVAAGLQGGLWVESWLNGPGKLPSSCSNRYDVNNVQQVALITANVTFASTVDHSKWAVSSNVQDTWICIGDINRAEHQMKRGGGTACMNNPSVAHLYKLSIATVESCK